MSKRLVSSYFYHRSLAVPLLSYIFDTSAALGYTASDSMSTPLRLNKHSTSAGYTPDKIPLIWETPLKRNDVVCEVFGAQHPLPPLLPCEIGSSLSTNSSAFCWKLCYPR
ncbi:hypothetical protein FB567DRAFT_536922 [Paraphoma chrysanthemicola]|uniref:Uncharacterized protein n=1 Tax=Paraphoma chrysanthemicola TaxID=798071 RepID=A0A8K0QVT7_9PLEO|nr:hypothetical protein FB567DRAFT_536922 [Paraphoma chrysanthemicola]